MEKPTKTPSPPSVLKAKKTKNKQKKKTKKKTQKNKKTKTQPETIIKIITIITCHIHLESGRSCGIEVAKGTCRKTTIQAIK